MTKRGGTLRTHHPRHMTQSMLLIKQQQAIDRANAQIRRASKEASKSFNQQTRTQPRHKRCAAKNNDEAAAALLFCLLTKRWFWYTMIVLFVIGWFFQ